MCFISVAAESVTSGHKADIIFHSLFIFSIYMIEIRHLLQFYNVANHHCRNNVSRNVLNVIDIILVIVNYTI